MTSNKLREEYNLHYERRNRHIKQLIEESIINVLAEQQADQMPPPVSTPTNQPPPEEPQAAATAQNEPVQKQYTVDDMITELNSIRGGKSFTDPEVYGKLVTFFKNLSDEQKADLKVLLVQIAELVTSVEEGSQNQSQPQDHNAAPPQMNNAQPPASAPQSSAPMPGAQASAGAAGVGVA